MADRYVQIGSMEDVHVYDDADFSYAVDTDGVIRTAGVEGGASGAVTVVTQIQVGGGGGIGFQYKNRVLTYTNGVITTIGAESGWNDI